MRFGTPALFLVAAGLLALPVVVAGLVPDDLGLEPGDEPAPLVRRERLVDNGRTKVTEFVNQRTGAVEYCTAGDPRSKVAVTKRGENGEHEVSIIPYEPTTDAGLKRMGVMTRRGIRVRTTACRPDDE